MIRIAIEDPDQPEIRRMLAEGEANSASPCPAESNHLPLDALRASGVLFHVARDVAAAAGRLHLAGDAVGTGAIVLRGDWAEVNRMWTAPSARGQGIAAAVLRAMEATAATRGARVLRLEAGIHSAAALALCRRFGFAEIAAFEGYAPDPLSVFMEKRLGV